jgi:hypothetical protein
MATPVDMIERLEQLKAGYETMISLSVEDTAAEFGRLNVEQMFAGMLSNDEQIEPPYAESTIRRKRKKGQPYDRVTLRDTNEFHEAYRLQVINDYLVEDSDVPYAEYLEKRYTPQIWGLNDENQEEYVDNFLAPDLQGKVSELTGLQHK